MRGGGDMTRDEIHEGREKGEEEEEEQREETLSLQATGHQTPGVGSHRAGCSEDERESGVAISFDAWCLTGSADRLSACPGGVSGRAARRVRGEWVRGSGQDPGADLGFLTTKVQNPLPAYLPLP